MRWRPRYKPSYRDLVELITKRPVGPHTTILRWVQQYAPALEFDKRWGRFSKQAGILWRVDETWLIKTPEQLDPQDHRNVKSKSVKGWGLKRFAPSLEHCPECADG